MRGAVEPWGCRAGQNTLIIRVDGTLAPCFPMYSATYDWGTVGNPKFEKGQLNEMKKDYVRIGDGRVASLPLDQRAALNRR